MLSLLLTQTATSSMPRQRRKTDLPQKTCAACGRPFTWRRRWARVWEEVRYCSDRCRKLKRAVAKLPPPTDVLNP